MSLIGHERQSVSNACPDGGACGHFCPIRAEDGKGQPCWRVSNAGPFSDTYPNDEWPREVKMAHGAAEIEPVPEEHKEAVEQAIENLIAQGYQIIPPGQEAPTGMIEASWITMQRAADSVRGKSQIWLLVGQLLEMLSEAGESKSDTLPGGTPADARERIIAEVIPGYPQALRLAKRLLEPAFQ